MVALLQRFVFELYLHRRHGVNVPKFFSQLAGVLVLAVAVFVVLELSYHQTIKGLLIAPGLAAVVIGLAMQDLVGNIIAGIALQTGKSFAQGDWLVIDNRHAEVIEINWRSTRLRTLDDISIEIPNREIARQTIVNLNRPERKHAIRLPVVLDYQSPPTRAKGVLLHAVANAKGVCPEPPPRVYLRNFGDTGIEYDIKFFLEDHSHYSEVCDAIRTNVWYGLHRHGVRIPFPTRTVQIERPERDKQQVVQTTARIMLRQQALFKHLTDEQLDALLPRGRATHFGQGEKVIQQGEDGESMFILVEGKASVVAERSGTPKLLAWLGAGDCFGEMSLLTGEKRNATVVAHTDCEVVEIGKAVLAKSLKEHPELLAQLSEMLAKRQMQTEGIFAADQMTDAAQITQTKYASSFVHKLRGFFEL
jgi:small-conductance mechanosensitive channel/CRP-like cAMP-binding protein